MITEFIQKGLSSLHRFAFAGFVNQDSFTAATYESTVDSTHLLPPVETEKKSGMENFKHNFKHNFKTLMQKY